MISNSTIRKIGGTGPDVLLIHGYGADRMTWLATAPALIRYASVWVIDLPGHGTASRQVGDGSVEMLAQLVRETIESAGLSKLHLIGHSLGGRLAVESAYLYPDSVWGRNDMINPLDAVKTTALPGKIHQLESCGHLPHMEQSVMLNKLLTRFHKNLMQSD